MMAYHQHIQMLVQSVDCVRHGGVGGGGKHVHGRRCPDDIRRMTAAGALRVIGVDGSSGNGVQGVLHTAAFIEGIGVDGHLYIAGVRHIQAVIDNRRGGTPVLVDFQAHGACLHLFQQRLFIGAVSFSQKADIHGIFLRRLQHPLHVPGTGGTGGGVGAVCRARSAADHGGHSAVQGAIHLLGRNEMNVGIQAAGRHNQSLARQRLGGSTHRHPRGNAVHHAGISRFADAGDFPVLDADISLENSRVIHHQGIGDHQVQITGRAGGFHRLTHAVSEGLAASEFALVSVCGIILFHLNHQAGVRQTYLVPNGGTVHHRIAFSGYLCAHMPNLPISV